MESASVRRRSWFDPMLCDPLWPGPTVKTLAATREAQAEEMAKTRSPMMGYM
jgi:hypothetical protein